MINREQAEALIQEQIVNTIFQDAPKSSVFLSTARKLPNMTSKQTRIPVLDMLPMAYWVNGDTGYKNITSQEWDNVYLTAAELAVIVPIPEAVLADASFDIFGEVTPRVNEAIGQRIDSAVIFGENRPPEWQNDIITLARQAGNNVSVSSSTNYYDVLLGENGVFAKIEENGYTVKNVLANTGFKAKLRGIKDANGQPIFKTDMQGATPYAIDGVPLVFPDNGSFNSKIAQLVAGDFSKAVYAIRQDITVKLLDQGVIQDPNTKAILYNLAQQDMVALRVVFRMGWALPNPATRLDNDRTACAFAYLEPTAPVITYKVAITVKDGSGEDAAAIEGATVDLNGSRLKTSSNGIAEFNLRNGTYPIKIKKNGYATANANITVNSASTTLTVAMVAN